MSFLFIRLLRFRDIDKTQTRAVIRENFKEREWKRTRER
jgi:hypothetical protein